MRLCPFGPVVLLALGCSPQAGGVPAASPLPLGAAIERRLAPERGTVAVAFIDLGSGDTVFRNADLRYHAASTMKVPVLIQLARDVDSGRTGWDEPVPVRNSFVSLADGSPFTLDPADDSDSSLYALQGQSVTQRRLAELMIERSSNLATNLLIARLDPARVDATAHRLGADSIQVRRGVEDDKAYARGLNNTTTARDLATLLAAIEQHRAASPAATREIVRMLLAQEFNDGIPAGLPRGVRVAHKTGSITALLHDAAIVYPAGRAPYVLVVLTRGYQDERDAARVIADVSRIVYRQLTGAAAE
jgi:beta-lactamase class A